VYGKEGAMLRIVVYHGSEEQVFAVSEREARFGSAPENDFVVRAPGVSRHHAVVRRVPDGVEVVDLGSKNGLYVEGRRVERAVLLPGLAIQIGMVWMEIEEISSSQESLARMLWGPAARKTHSSPRTATLDSGGYPLSHSPADVALALACHIAQVGTGLPGARADLFLRIKYTLGAEAFGSFESTRRGKLIPLETTGEFLPEDVNVLASLAADVRTSNADKVVLTRNGSLLLAGREEWFLGVKFPEESITREGWRKDLLRFLVHQFYMPVRSLEDVNSSEAARVLALAKGNKRKAALLLGVSRGTLYKLLARRHELDPE
jgi:hypothetical protein